MLSFFRNFIKSPIGLITVFVVLGIIAVAFMLTPGVPGLDTIGAGAGGRVVLAKVGDKEITESDVRQQIDLIQRGMQQRGQAFSMNEFLAQGGFEAALQQLISARATVAFQEKNGMEVSKRLIDSQITSIPSFQGPDGKFDQKAFDEFLRRQRFTAQQVRSDISDSIYQDWMLMPLLGKGAVPDNLVASYAGLQLVRRFGKAAVVPTVIDTATTPDDKAIAAWYNAHKATYMVPEQRVIRYAAATFDAIKAKSAPTDAEVADAYKKAADRFAAKDKRTVRQLVLSDQATANRIFGEVKGGKAIADEAKSLGLEAGNFEAVEKPDLAKQSTAAVADAAFAAKQGDVVGPVRTPFGWAVLKIEKVENVAAKSLADAHDDLVKELTEKKTTTTLVNLRQAADDAIGDGSNFNQLLGQLKLTAQTLGPVAADGTNPADPAAKPDPAMAAIIRAGFTSQPGDDPKVVPTAEDGSFAVAIPDRVIVAKPKPVADVREDVIKAIRIDAGMKRAQAKAKEIVAKLNAGVAFEKAFADAGVPPAGMKGFDYVVGEIGKSGKPTPETIASLQVPLKKAAALPNESGSGYLVIYTEGVEEHDAKGNQELMGQVRARLLQLSGNEQLAELGDAIRRDLKIVRNEKAIAALKAALQRDAAR
ncbi:peptidylprolyl isomerase [Sphingomonas sp.]|uniref:peptidylprolyl isomerase n=1 Tax=Sphingomonas sp. TaxID=28214 RepID=UPI001B182E26|nr:peptidylprolyl isomerase [Sphingomonas sp.]MBO9712244.1 SurA N-terminal domain-containing protein [Sphingomonas sp.]